MTIDEEESDVGNFTGNVTTAAFSDADVMRQHTSKWSPGMWTYDTHAWSQRAHDVMNDGDEACPGEPESDEEFEEVYTVQPELVDRCIFL